MSEYDMVSQSEMKLKGASEGGIKKKKKKKVEEMRVAAVARQQITRSSTNGLSPDDSLEEKKVRIKKTKAQLAFEKMQEKRQMQKILEKASKTHKQRVEEFNRHLDSLTEHYDIPKVSWTK